jgi:hypothetical protein
MKRNHRKLGLAAALSLAAIGTAYAQSPAQPPQYGCMQGAESGMGMMGGRGIAAGMMGRGNPAARMENRLSVMKSELQITPQQEAAWDALTTQAKKQADAMQSMRTTMFEAKGNAPERMEQRTQLMQGRVAGMGTMTAAMKTLYAQLSPAQQATLNQRFGTMAGTRNAMPASAQ